MKIAIVCEPAHFQFPDKAMHPETTRIIFDVLRGVGFDPKVDIAWVPLCKPIPKADVKSDARTWSWIEKFLPAVQERLQGVDVIMTLGKHALQAVAGKGSSMKDRGVPQVREGFTLLPTLTPGQAKYDPSVLNKLKVDAARLRQLVEDGGKLVDRPAGDYKWFRDTQHLKKIRAAAIDFEGINEGDGTALDWSHPDSRLWTLQVTWKAGMAAVIPLHRELWLKVFGSLEGYDQAQADVRAFLYDPAIAKVGHNIAFDLHAGANQGYPIRGVTDDTMLMSWFADENQLVYNLNECVAVHVPAMAGFNDAWEAKIVDKGRMQDVSLDVLLAYAGNDTCSCWALRVALHEKLSKLPEHYNVYKRVKMPALLSFVRLEEEGVHVDQERLQGIAGRFVESYSTMHDAFVVEHAPGAVKRRHLELAEEKIRSAKVRNWEAQIETHQSALRDEADEKARLRKENLIAVAKAKIEAAEEETYPVDAREVLKLTRADFVRDIFFSKEGFRLDPKQYTESTEDLEDEEDRLASTSIKHLKLYLSERPNDAPVSKSIRAASALSTVGKMISTYSGRPEDRDLREKGIWQHLKPHGRYHSSYSLTGTNTGRTAARAPNDQNIPVRTDEAKALKAAWVSPNEEEWILLAADLSQIELRIAAWESGDEAMLRTYRNGEDIHALTASRLVQMALAAFMKMDKAYRTLARTKAKAANFGFVYGMHAPSFRDFAEQQYETVLTLEEARAFRAVFFETYTALPAWHEARWSEACKYGYVTSLHGQRRRLPMLEGANWRDFNSLDPKQRDALRQAVNAPVQLFGSDLNIAGKARLQAQNLEWLRVNRSIHDAIYAYCRRDRVVEGVQAMVYAMQSVPLGDWFGIEMPIPLVSEADVGFSADKMIELAEPPSVEKAPEWFEPLRADLDWARKGERPSFWKDVDQDLLGHLTSLRPRSVHAYVA